MYFIITLNTGDTIPISLQKTDPSDEELIELFTHSIPQFHPEKRYVAMSPHGDCIVYENGTIYRMSDSH
jgi:hypothetical protein